MGALFLGVGFAPGVAKGATVTTVADLTLMGGQNFVDGTASSFGGNVDAVVTPVVKFSDQWSLFPTYHGYYQGTEEIQSLAGGGLLFRDYTGQSFLLKSVHTLGSWKLKPSLGATLEWLRETRDEDWGQGLYDYRKYNGGLEAEYDLSQDVGGRVAYDYYQIRFPNYQSLESAQDPTLSRELAGEDVLNNANHMATAGVWTSLSTKGRLEVTGMYDLRSYADQPLVDQAGQLTNTDRKDKIYFLDSTVGYPFPGPHATRLYGQLGFRYGFQNSNQNHFDAKKYSFQSNYYDYSEWRVAPEVTSSISQGQWILSLGGSYEQRDYGSRPTQDTLGNDQDTKLYVRTILTRLSLSHSLTPRAKLRVEGSLGWSHSNTAYEDVFKYNYRMASYGLGFSYAY